MIIDFHTHFVPEALSRRNQTAGDGVTTVYVDGVPAQSFHSGLYDMGKRIAIMDAAGIDLSVLSSGAGIEGDLETCRLVNDGLRDLERAYPGRVMGMAHVPPLGGATAFAELRRCRDELGFRGAAMASDLGMPVDSPQLWPFYEQVAELGLFLFVHPAWFPLGTKHMDGYDLARSVGREFSLCEATIRFINSGLLDDFPSLTICMSHLGGGISALMGRIRGYQDKEFWGTAGNARHGKLPKREFDDYFARIYFDTGGFSGHVGAVQTALVEMSPRQLLFGTDYPQEIRDAAPIQGLAKGIQDLPIAEAEKQAIFNNNARRILGL